MRRACPIANAQALTDEAVLGVAWGARPISNAHRHRRGHNSSVCSSPPLSIGRLNVELLVNIHKPRHEKLTTPD